jgi:hypothetical protein
MSERILILVSGPARHGKDTIAAHLTESFGFSRYGFGDPIKEIARTQYGWDGQKDDRGRALLQAIGVHGRAYDLGIWVKKALAKAEEEGLPERIVIPDWRFPDEVETVQAWAAGHGYAVKTARVLRTCEDGHTLFDNGLGELNQHESETALADYNCHILLKNVTGNPGVLADGVGYMTGRWGVDRPTAAAVPMRGWVLAADELADDFVTRLKTSGKKIVTFDFDDTIRCKGPMKVFQEGRTALFRALAASPDILPLVVTSRDGSRPSFVANHTATGEIQAFLEEVGIRVAGIVYQAGTKVDTIRRLGAVAHFDDDVNVARACAEAGINALAMGEWLSPKLGREWAECDDPHLAAERPFYLLKAGTGGIEEFLQRRVPGLPHVCRCGGGCHKEDETGPER